MSNSPIQEEASPLTDSGVDPITRVASGSSPLVLPWPPARTPVRAGREGRGPAQCGALKIIKFRGDLTNHAIAVRDLDRVPSVGNNRDGPSARPQCRAVRHKMRSVQWDCDWVRNRRRPGWRGLLLPPAASGPASTSPLTLATDPVVVPVQVGCVAGITSTDGCFSCRPDCGRSSRS